MKWYLVRRKDKSSGRYEYLRLAFTRIAWVSEREDGAWFLFDAAQEIADRYGGDICSVE